MHLDRVLIAADKPALRGGAPVVGNFGLHTVFKLLLENAQLVADGVARGLKPLGRHGVHVAGGKSAETAVAETRIRLLLKDVGSVVSHVGQRADDRLGDAEIVGVFHKAAPHEKLHGHIVYLFLRVSGVLDGENTAHQLTDDDGRRLENLFFRGLFPGDAELRTEFILYRASHFVPGYLVCHRLPPEFDGGGTRTGFSGAFPPVLRLGGESLTVSRQAENFAAVSVV